MLKASGPVWVPHRETKRASRRVVHKACCVTASCVCVCEILMQCDIQETNCGQKQKHIKIDKQIGTKMTQLWLTRLTCESCESCEPPDVVQMWLPMRMALLSFEQIEARHRTLYPIDLAIFKDAWEGFEIVGQQCLICPCAISNSLELISLLRGK